MKRHYSPNTKSARLGKRDVEYCPSCGFRITIQRKVEYISKYYYNQGLEKATIRDLSGASLGITLALLVVNFLSVLSSGWVGTALNALLTILSTPMIASGYWALSLFLWAFLFIASCKKQ